MRPFLILSAFAAVPLLACSKKESVDSQDVTTHGMSLEMDVVNDGTKSKVYTALHVGSWESLVWARLSTGDELEVLDPAGNRQALGLINSSGKTAYGADLPATEGVFTLNFKRAKGASAIGNKVTVPPAFTVAAPATHARREPLTFTWNAAPSSGSTMSYSLIGDCISSHSPRTITGDPGTFTINAGDLKPLAGKENESCQLTLKMTRSVITTGGCCSAEFGHPSRTNGVQERFVTFQSNP